MEKRTSGITTLPFVQRLAVGGAIKAANRQAIQHSIPALSLAGVPGEPDHRKFLTATMQKMIPVQTGDSTAVVGSIAYSTNSKQWRDYDPKRYQGLFASAGEYDPRPYYVTYDPLNPPKIGKVVPPSRAVVTTNSQAGPFSIKVVQETDVF